jgi:hypothetical protein
LKKYLVNLLIADYNEITLQHKDNNMIRFKTKTDNTGKNGNEAFHIVAEASLDLMQDHWTRTQTILGLSIRRSYKTLKGAEKSLKQGEVVVMEKPIGIQ